MADGICNALGAAGANLVVALDLHCLLEAQPFTAARHTFACTGATLGATGAAKVAAGKALGSARATLGALDNVLGSAGAALLARGTPFTAAKQSIHFVETIGQMSQVTLSL